jgi:hypothetical protein
MVKAVGYLSGVLAAEPQRAWPIGPLGHALRGLSVYQRRVFRSAEASPAESTPETASLNAAPHAPADWMDGLNDGPALGPALVR